MLPADLPEFYRAEAARVEPYNPGAAHAWREAATAAEAAWRAFSDELLTLAVAARESGYSVDHLQELVSTGAIPNAGQKGRPRIRRADLPKKATAVAKSTGRNVSSGSAIIRRAGLSALR